MIGSVLLRLEFSMEEISMRGNFPGRSLRSREFLKENSSEGESYPVGIWGGVAVVGRSLSGGFSWCESSPSRGKQDQLCMTSDGMMCNG